MNELALFAGAGGGILGGKLLGWRTVCAVENDPYAAGVLCARQNDGSLPPFPIWDDVRTFDGRPWRGLVEVISGGFPCQDISVAGDGEGITGERSGLWGEFARIIGEVRPRFVFVENSPALTTRGLGTVLGDLASMGFNAEWGVLGAHQVGVPPAPHKRDRIWIMAYTDCIRGDEVAERIVIEVSQTGASELVSEEAGGEELAYTESQRGGTGLRRSGTGKVAEPSDGSCRETKNMADADLTQFERGWIPGRASEEHSDPGGSSWWSTEPDVGRVAHGVAARVDRLTAIGNGQVPAVAALAWKTLRERSKI